MLKNGHLLMAVSLWNRGFIASVMPSEDLQTTKGLGKVAPLRTAARYYPLERQKCYEKNTQHTLTATPWRLLSDADEGRGGGQTGFPASDVTELYDLTRCANPHPLSTWCHWHSGSSWEMMMECFLGLGFLCPPFQVIKNVCGSQRRHFWSPFVVRKPR